MPSWADIGHAMRRRAGYPSSHLAASEPPVASHYQSVDQAAQAHAAAGSAKIPVGVVDLNQPAARGTARPRGNTQSGNPSADPKGNRAAVERNGAAYRVTAKIAPQHDPVAGPTMASARLIGSVHGRNTAFQQQRGIDSSN